MKAGEGSFCLLQLSELWSSAEEYISCDCVCLIHVILSIFDVKVMRTGLQAPRVLQASKGAASAGSIFAWPGQGGEGSKVLAEGFVGLGSVEDLWTFRDRAGRFYGHCASGKRFLVQRNLIFSPAEGPYPR